MVKNEKKEGISEDQINRIQESVDNGKVDWKNLRDTVSQGLQNLIENAGICCFSAISDSVLMWGHYASLHTGVCFKFEINSEDPFFQEVLPVQYRRRRPLMECPYKDENNLVDTILLTKNIDWKYEHEYRIIKREGVREYEFPSDLLKGIIFGARIDQAHEKELSCEANKKGTPLYRAKLSESLYKIEMKLISSTVNIV